MWSDPKHPGDMVRVLHLQRRGEFGMVCIQQFNDSVRVASFLPGTRQQLGGTLILHADKFEWVGSKYRADELFDTYVYSAYDDLWQNAY